jgi:transcriptional regulator with XRE-family HTH domain
MTITGVQLKAARELIGLSQLAFAVQFQLGRRDVADFEAGKYSLPWQTARHLERALEAAALEFTKESPGCEATEGEMKAAWLGTSTTWRLATCDQGLGYDLLFNRDAYQALKP